MRARLLHVAGPVLLAATLLGAPARGADFNHDAHNQKADIKNCDVCHKPKATSILPDTAVCRECHEERPFTARLRTHGPFWVNEHGRDAKNTDSRCSRCHEQKFCVECHKGDPKIHRPQSHLAGFLETHPIKATGNRDSCLKCHETKFCTDCHKRFRGDELMPFSHRKGWSNLMAGGVNHQTRYQGDPNSCATCHPGGMLTTHEWTRGHEKEARRSLTSCQSCHPEGDVCKRCHSAREGLKANPHPKNWKDKHERIAKASGERSCRACHDSRSRDEVCRRCHH